MLPCHEGLLKRLLRNSVFLTSLKKEGIGLIGVGEVAKGQTRTLARHVKVWRHFLWQAQYLARAGHVRKHLSWQAQGIVTVRLRCWLKILCYWDWHLNRLSMDVWGGVWQGCPMETPYHRIVSLEDLRDPESPFYRAFGNWVVIL